MLQEDIRLLLTPVVEDLGYILWGCEYLSQGKHSLLRIFIDHENGIGIEDCEITSRQISSVLDVEDPIPGNYQLEVSSPGLPRPLFYPWQYTNYIGHDVNLKLYKPVDRSRKLSGTIEQADENSLHLKIGDERFEIPFTNIVKAYLTV